jgi:multidrug efflux system outer membrane protein
VTTQNDSVTLTTLCVEHGIANTVDLLQAQQVLDSAFAQIPDLERLISQEEDATSILLGGYSHAVTRGRPLVEERANTSARGATRSAFVPIARRPDIHQAEQIVVRQMPRSESLPVLPTSPRRSSFLKWR